MTARSERGRQGSPLPPVGGQQSEAEGGRADRNDHNKSKNTPGWLGPHPGVTAVHVLIRVAENCRAAQETDVSNARLRICFLLTGSCEALICHAEIEANTRERRTRSADLQAVACTGCNEAIERKYQLRNKIPEPRYCCKIPFRRSILRD